jgi:hypothetical protein
VIKRGRNMSGIKKPRMYKTYEALEFGTSGRSRTATPLQEPDFE